jgi:putative ubiquitin-RnfH superfamily antitoxin RatB of RatAB toxin-antitoxin module
MNMRALVHVEVCYALPGQQTLIAVTLPAGATLRQAIDASGIASAYPALDLDAPAQKFGVFGKIRPADATLADHDRVEIYRPLVVDPKTARQRRADKIRQAGSVEGRKWLPKDMR